MNLIIKIAAGVFLGIMAIYIAIRIPGWVTQWREERAQRVMMLMSPEKLIARCGKPSGDKTSEWEGSQWDIKSRFRTVSYGAVLKGGIADRDTRVLEFKMDEGENWWTLERFSVDYETTPIDDPVDQIKLLPCLNPK